MPLDARGIELNDPGRINRELQKLRREIDALRSERRASATTIGDGGLRLTNGGSLVVDGGEVLMLDADGSVMFRLGDQVHGDRGFLMARDDGTLALAVRKAIAGPGAQGIEIRDRQGYLIYAEEALGNGPARPLLHLPFQPVAPSPTTLQHGPHGIEVPTTSATFTTTHQAWFARHNQYARLMLRVAASDATTSAEIQVVDAGTGIPLGDFLSGSWLGARATGTTGYVQVDPPRLFLPGAPDERVSIAVQVRRSAGSGTLRVALPESHGA